MEIKIIYEVWSEHQKERQAIRHKWCEVDKYLHENCSDSVREVIEGYLLEFGVLMEEKAFSEGDRAAFRLWLDVLNKKL